VGVGGGSSTPKGNLVYIIHSHGFFRNKGRLFFTTASVGLVLMSLLNIVSRIF
jgi:hypothetical protein